MPADARKLNDAKGKRYWPRYPAAVWIRIDGAWRPGHVFVQLRTRDGWAMWTQYDAEGVPWPAWAMFAYDPQTIRPRDSDTPPAD